MHSHPGSMERLTTSRWISYRKKQQNNARCYPKSHIKNTPRLQLGLGLGLLQHRVKLGRLHDVALDLELAAHEETLSIGLASDELAKVLLGEDEGDIRLFAGASRNLSGLLEIDMPAGLIATRVLEGKGVDAVALLDGVLAIGIAGVDSLLNGVEGGRGGELVVLERHGC
jgi:hypothetical protein